MIRSLCVNRHKNVTPFFRCYNAIFCFNCFSNGNFNHAKYFVLPLTEVGAVTYSPDDETCRMCEIKFRVTNFTKFSLGVCTDFRRVTELQRNSMKFLTQF